VNGSATYRVCVYDASADPQPLLEADVPPGGTCGSRPCWKAVGTTSFLYKNKAGTPNGLTSLKLRSGPSGRPRIQAKGKGASLAMPPLELTLPVTVQFVIDNGSSTECWQTIYTTAIANDPSRFTAKGP
jgi:hypothetical protein